MAKPFTLTHPGKAPVWMRALAAMATWAGLNVAYDRPVTLGESQGWQTVTGIGPLTMTISRRGS